ncbi:MAG: dihydroneopterin aldolase [Candidatus Halichondribacter symbioticus]
MTDETALAFGDLATRAGAGGCGTGADRLILRDYTRHGEIGAFTGEYGAEQGLRFNIVAEVTVAADPHDDVDSVLSYDTLTQAIDDQLAQERLHLLETLAERICAQILDCPQVARVFIRIEKLDRIDGALGIEIVRTRADNLHHGGVKKWDAPVVFIPCVVAESGDTERLVKDLLTRYKGAIVCMEAAHETPQNTRIHLLAMEQNAWRILGKVAERVAEHDPHLAVLSSRTEIDSAVRANTPALWAPAKIWTDAAPALTNPSSLEIAQWFADEFFQNPLQILKTP